MIIKSILDTDLYKFTTSYAYMRMYPDAVGTFSFNDRDNTEYTQEFVDKLRIELYNLAQLELTGDEFEHMTKECRFISRFYWEWLYHFKFDANKVNVWLDDDKHLHITVTDLLYKATLYEVPLLAMVSELRNKAHQTRYELIRGAMLVKIGISNRNSLYFSEFGTRRRFSYEVQDIVIEMLQTSALYCTGTSNCHFAMKYGMKMMGTHPHEWFMFHGAIYGYRQANYKALEAWVDVYDGDLGIALTDTYTSDIFFSNFSRKHAKLFDGIRQDSGDEFAFTNKAIARYKELGISPSSKTIIFSNALTFPKALDIMEYCGGRIRSAFGIGTNLTCDSAYVTDETFRPANIVMKLVSCQMNKNQPEYTCVKLSDDLGKHTGIDIEVKRCKDEIRV